MTRPTNAFEQSQLDRLYQELDRYTCLVETEKAKRAAMENEFTELREEIWKRRKQMGGVNADVNNKRQSQKQVMLLESRLGQALVKFNKTVSRNKRLREEIDGLRGERVTFEKVYKKIEKVSFCVLFRSLSGGKV
jgi:chromosome segregation ATPase